MTARDRLVLIVVAVLVVLGAGWVMVVSPERKQASKLSSEVNAASSQLASAEGQLSNAREAKSRYAAAYSSIVELGKAVPPGREMPGLVYQLARASDQKHVDFTSIVSGSGSGGGSGSGSSGSSAQPAALAGFTQMPFTFVFNGTFFDLYHLFQQLNRFTVRTASGVQVSGRLLTIQSAKLAPAPNSSEHGSHGPPVLTGTITATAYVLPAAQGLTGGASPAGPTPASSTSPGATSPAAPALARVTP